MKSNMMLNVEFLIGTSIEGAVREAREKAFLLNLAYVCFKFNGVSFSIGQNADIEEVLKDFNDDKKNICHS